MKKISIFGSTGTIGSKTCDIISQNNCEYKVEALTANKNIELLAKQAKLLNPTTVVIVDDNYYLKLKELLSYTNIEVKSGYTSLLEIASIRVDWAMLSIVGIAALNPFINLIKSATKVIACANKESIICGGNLLLNLAKNNGVEIIPVDSEHNAIFQVFCEQNKNEVEEIILTASGGPFLNYTYEQLKDINVNEAILHPIWNMGKKISIDSATMMNKALEVIEAYNLFNLRTNQISCIIHPESIVHGIISYVDGTLVSVMSCADMAIPISYSLTWPKRKKLVNGKLNLSEQKFLTFLEPDYNTFPALKLGFEVLNSTDLHLNSVILNASNEEAVELFLNGSVRFLDIAKISYESLEKLNLKSINSFEDIIDRDKETRAFVKSLIKNFYDGR